MSTIPQNTSSARPLVLVVDDEPRIRRALRRFLRPSGYEVLEAENGDHAISLAQEHQPDMVVLDLRMPGTDGFTVASALRSGHGEDIHIIVLSAADDADHRLRAFDAGADDFLSKPANLDELTRRIEAARRMQEAWRAERRARERAEKLQVMNSEAVSLVAHDLNNGFAVIMGNLQFLEEESQGLDEDEHEALESSLRALRRMIGLTSNFVDVSRMEEGALTAQLVGDVDVAELVENAASIHTPSARKDRDGASVELDCESGLRARLDPALVERVLHNLIGNALRYVDSGGTIRVTSSSDDGRVRLSVSNSGSKVPPELQPHLFDKYRKGPDGRAMRGMGLYFCRLACEAHGGTIALDPEADGTSFLIELPGAESATLRAAS